jgi:hypothetical protein
VGNDWRRWSKQHTSGNTKRWTVNYVRWLDNSAEIERIDVQSSSATCTVSQPPQILGRAVSFFLNGGMVGDDAGRRGKYQKWHD